MGSDNPRWRRCSAWLANDFNASRRHALIVAHKLGQKLTHGAVMVFIKLIGRLFA